ncbi:sister chromatid cohesion protein solo [Drosophila montana]|uniref:sister chromatid cohesion protein solo n=1 Tax=Drosophila montana TaxID=40370 RepID=UPI00313EEB81
MSNYMFVCRLFLYLVSTIVTLTVAQLMLSGNSLGQRVPKSYDAETVSAYIENLKLNLPNQSLIKLREQRDYLLKSFSSLVNSEWNLIQESERKQRQEKFKKLCAAAAASSDSVMAEVAQLLEESEDELQQFRCLPFGGGARAEQFIEDAIVVPCAQQRREMSMTAPTTPRTRAPGTTTTTPGKRAPGTTTPGRMFNVSARQEETVAAPQQSLDQAIKIIRKLFKNAARDFELNNGKLELATDESMSTTNPMPSDEQRQQEFPIRWLSENFMLMREMRKLRSFDPSEMYEELPWPDLDDNPVWLYNKQPPVLAKPWLVPTAPEQQQQLGEGRDRDEAISLPPLARQAVQSHSQNTPGQDRLLQDVQDSEAGANATPLVTSNAAQHISNDGLPSIPTGDNQAANLTDEDMHTLYPPLPVVSPMMEVESITLPIGGERSASGGENNVSTPLLLRTRHAHASTPLQAYRTQLPAIDEEQQNQNQNRATMPRVLELSEDYTTETARAAAATGPATADQAEAISHDIPILFTPPANTSPPLTRDWTSIFRPRTALPIYAPSPTSTTTTPPLPPRRRRKRRLPRPPSDDEVMLGFLSNMFQERWSQIEQQTEAVDVPQHANEMPAGTEPPALPMDLDEIPDRPAAAEDIEPQVLPMQTDELRDRPPTTAEGIEPPTLPMQTDELPDRPPTTAGGIEPPALSMNLDELPERPIVTSIEVIYQPPSVIADAGQLVNLTEISTTGSPILVDASQLPKKSLVMQSAANQSAGMQLLTRSERVERELREDLSFLVEHKHLLRLMVDHTKYLSDKQQREDQLRNYQSLANRSHPTDDSDERSEGEQNIRYVALPAIYTYDPKMILEMPEWKPRVVHNLIGALIRNDQIDMRATGFIETRMEAAFAFRVLLELKAANIISLSPDARYASLL